MCCVFLCFCHFRIWCLGSDVKFDCFDSCSLLSSFTFTICLPIDHLSKLLKALGKNHFKMLSAFAVCCIYLLSLLATASVESNIMCQTRQLILEQSDLGPYCLTMRNLKHLSGRQKQTTFVVIGALRIKRTNLNLDSNCLKI